MHAGQCPEAAEYIKSHEKEYGANQKLLFLLDTAMISMLCGNYKESNEYFQKADDLADYLWTKSITKETASFLLNDYTKPYAGEEFERVLINLFSAINYVRLGRHDDALVECRRLDTNLTAINDKYEKKNVYKEDAFARYLSGILYEADKNPDDAFIDYYKAYQTFRDYEKNYNTPVPRILLEDLFRTAEAVGRFGEVRPVYKEFSNTKWLKQGETKGLGKVVFIHFNGKSPVKREDKLMVPTKEGIITLAFPRYEVIPPYCRSSRVIAESRSLSQEAVTELVEDINGIALKNLEDRKARIIAKTIARAAIKKAAMHSVSKNRNTEVLLSLVNTLIERADTRTWRTLPGEIYLSRMFLPAGKYRIYAEQCKRGRQHIETVNLKAGETRFVLFESMY